jgi:two-component system nitrogen regulation sensor histidine kinase GlnL
MQASERGNKSPGTFQVMDSRNFLSQLIDNLSTAVLVFDTDLNLSFISPSAQAMLELSESRGLGCRLEDLFPAQPEFIHLDSAGSLPDHAYTHRGITLSTGSGQEFIADCTISPLISEQRDGAGLVFEIHAVDRIVRINRDEGLIASQQNARALMRGLAHEIKNPLGGLRGAAQLLARELPDPALEEYTRVIIREADRLRGLVDRMLGPHGEPQLVSLNIHEILEHICSLQKAELGDRVTFQRDYDPSLPNLMGDRSQLIQATLNIIRNAVQATDSLEGERTIVLRTRVQRQFTIGSHCHRLVCRLDIVDNGPGINDDIRHYLFTPMVSGRPDGTGLGLAISQSIISRHQGLIEFRSEPGCTEFTIFLPLDTEHAES